MKITYTQNYNSTFSGKKSTKTFTAEITNQGKLEKIIITPSNGQEVILAVKNNKLIDINLVRDKIDYTSEINTLLEVLDVKVDLNYETYLTSTLLNYNIISNINQGTYGAIKGLMFKEGTYGSNNPVPHDKFCKFKLSSYLSEVWEAKGGHPIKVIYFTSSIHEPIKLKGEIGDNNINHKDLNTKSMSYKNVEMLYGKQQLSVGTIIECENEVLSKNLCENFKDLGVETENIEHNKFKILNLTSVNHFAAFAGYLGHMFYSPENQVPVSNNGFNQGYPHDAIKFITSIGEDSFNNPSIDFA